MFFFVFFYNVKERETHNKDCLSREFPVCTSVTLRVTCQYVFLRKSIFAVYNWLSINSINRYLQCYYDSSSKPYPLFSLLGTRILYSRQSSDVRQPLGVVRLTRPMRYRTRTAHIILGTFFSFSDSMCAKLVYATVLFAYKMTVGTHFNTWRSSIRLVLGTRLFLDRVHTLTTILRRCPIFSQLTKTVCEVKSSCFFFLH